MRVLVTGATGQVGVPFLKALHDSNLVDYLRVVGPDQPDMTLGIDEWVCLDFNDEHGYDVLCEGIDVVYHLGAETGKNYHVLYEVNVRATR